MVLHKLFIFSLIAIASLSISSMQSLQAGNLSFLDYSAISYFQGKDKEMMLNNIEDALNHYPDNKKATWKNPATGTFGFAIPSQTVIKNGVTCRNLKIFNNAQNVTGEENYRMCKYGNEWRYTPN